MGDVDSRFIILFKGGSDTENVNCVCEHKECFDVHRKNLIKERSDMIQYMNNNDVGEEIVDIITTYINRRRFKCDHIDELIDEMHEDIEEMKNINLDGDITSVTSYGEYLNMNSVNAWSLSKLINAKNRGFNFGMMMVFSYPVFSMIDRLRDKDEIKIILRIIRYCKLNVDEKDLILFPYQF